jgi:hypothetical protein
LAILNDAIMRASLDRYQDDPPGPRAPSALIGGKGDHGPALGQVRFGGLIFEAAISSPRPPCPRA